MSADADTTHILATPWSRARGVIGRYPGPGEAYVFEYDEVARRSVHMVGVRKPLRVRWYGLGTLIEDTVLHPWVGHATHPADTVVETRPDG